MALHPISAHPRLPEKKRKAIIAAVLELRSTVAGRVLLRKIRMDKPTKANYKQDYLYLESLNLSNYGTLKL